MAKQVSGSLTSLKSVKHWFMVGKMPYWTLYKGQPQSKETNVATIAKNPDIEDLEESWQMLESLLEIYENGIFTILAKPKYEATAGLNKIVYSVGFNEDLGQNQNGINSLPIQYQNASGIGAIIEKELEKEKHLWNLEKKIEDMESSMNVKETFGNKIMGMLESNMPLLLENVIPMLLNKFMPVAKPGAIAGPKLESINQNENEIIASSLERIAVHFSLVEALPKLADFIESNPEMAKTFLK
jgi:hypothetical protein